MSQKVIISGGGTGGHIFPAIAIANTLLERNPDMEILFVGAKDRMEMEKVPQAGFNIVGLNVAGIQRSISPSGILKNMRFPFKLIDSVWDARKIVSDFNPAAVVGVGGYASGPVLWVAQQKNIPTLIQEQNSYAGLTNRMLARKARKICVSYDGMDKYFPKEKIVLTGNPVRKEIIDADLLKIPSLIHYKFSAERKTILVVGGSLGAKTINESIFDGLNLLKENGYQLIWQTGKSFFQQAKEKIENERYVNFRAYDFIKEMHWAYAAADVVVTRAGALAISELCLIGKPTILVPSPNVSEDHQTKNAMALVKKEAAWIVIDKNCKTTLVQKIIDLVEDKGECNKLNINMRILGKPKSTDLIVDEILKIIN